MRRNQYEPGMGWWLKVTASALFTAAAIVVACVWVRSHWTFDRITMPIGRNRMLMLISYRGSVTITFADLSIPKLWIESGRSHPIGTRTPDWIWPRERVLGFGWAYRDLMANMPNPPAKEGDPSGVTGRSWAAGGSGAMLPDWFVILGILALAALPWHRPRFSLRNLLVAITLAAILIAIFSSASRAPMVQWENGVLVTE